METDAPSGRSRLSRWALLLLVVPLLGVVFLVRSGGSGAVDLYTEDDLALAGVELSPTGDPLPAVGASADAQDGPTSPATAEDTGTANNNSPDGTAGEDVNADGTQNGSIPEALSQTSETANDGTTTGTVGTPTNNAAASPTPSKTTTANAPNPNVPATTVPGNNEPATPTGDQNQTDPTPISETNSTLWCEIEVREQDGVIRWSDEDRTAVFRRNDVWFHTPEEAALAVLIPEVVDTNDDYVLRVWGGGQQDIACTFVAGATQTATPTTTTTAPTTTTTTTSTTTTVPEAVAFAQLPNPIAIPGGPVQMGFNVDLWGTDRTNYWNELEAVPGNGRLIAHEFKSFTKPINTSLYQSHMNQGRDLLLTWNGTTASSILDGTHDAWIRQHAQELQTLSGTVKLRFWHEPDVSYKASWIEGDPQNYIDAWMYVRRLFVEEGAVDNIEWVWCPTAWNWNEQGARFYPGDANVDWICADGYSGMNLNQPLSSIANEFTAFQAWANQHPSKPILIAEFGATEREPGDRAAWVQGIPGWVNASPNIRAVVYFDYDKRSEQPWDWRLRTEADAWQEMKNVLSSAPFGN